MILVYENTKEIWEEEISIKAAIDKNDEDKWITIRQRMQTGGWMIGESITRNSCQYSGNYRIMKYEISCTNIGQRTN